MAETKNRRLRVLVGILLFVGGYALFLLYYNLYFSRLSEIEKWGISHFMEQRANEAIESAHVQYDVELDRSPESIEAVENILAQLHTRDLKQPGLKHPGYDSHIISESEKWGAYIGEVLKTQKNCQWQHDPKTGAITLQLTENKKQYDFMPTVWCYGRIKRGEPEDNVWLQFLYLTAKPNSRQSEQLDALEKQIRTSGK